MDHKNDRESYGVINVSCEVVEKQTTDFIEIPGLREHVYRWLMANGIWWYKDVA